MWHYVWWCDTMYDDVTLRMTLCMMMRHAPASSSCAFSTWHTHTHTNVHTHTHTASASYQSHTSIYTYICIHVCCMHVYVYVYLCANHTPTLTLTHPHSHSHMAIHTHALKHTSLASSILRCFSNSSRERERERETERETERDLNGQAEQLFSLYVSLSPPPPYTHTLSPSLSASLLCVPWEGLAGDEQQSYRQRQHLDRWNLTAGVP